MEKEIRLLFKDEILREAARKFGLDYEKLNLIGGFQNFVYEGESNSRKYILRITHSSHRSINSIEGELEFVTYLSNNGVPASRPVLSLNGELSERIEAEGCYFTAAMFEKAEGRRLSYPEYLGDEGIFKCLGRITGRMHYLSKSYRPGAEGISRHDWIENYYLQNLKRFIPEEQEEIFRSCSELVETIKSLHRNESSYGLIHGDINVGNFMAGKSGITLFDFDECQYSWFLEDIAIQLFYTAYVNLDDSIEERQELGSRFMKGFMEGYREENYFDDDSMKHLDLFLRLREIIVYAGMYRSLDLENANQWVRDYVSQSRGRIEGRIPLVNL